MKAINIIFADKGPDLVFVETENDDGVSVGLGTWTNDGEYQKLRITDEEMPAVPYAVEVERAEKLAEKFHETYEKLAPYHGHKTNEKTAVPWSDMPENHKQLMVHVCAKLLREWV